MINKREDFFKPVELNSREVEISRLGKVRFQEMNGATQARYEMFMGRKGVEAPDHKLKLITLCVVDANNQQIMTEADFPELRKLPGETITQLAVNAMMVNSWADGTEFKKNETDLETAQND